MKGLTYYFFVLLDQHLVVEYNVDTNPQKGAQKR
jgi:hypothetical protein